MFKSEILFLDRIVSAVSPALSMKEYCPKTVREVRKLMGFLNYYRRYIENFSIIAKPIYDLAMLVDRDDTTTKPNRKMSHPTPTKSTNNLDIHSSVSRREPY